MTVTVTRGRLLIILFFAPLLLSCGGPSDQSFWAVSGTSYEPLPGMQGAVVSADGEPSSPSGETLGGTTRRLLTFIFLTPQAGGNGSEGGGFNSGGAVAKFELSNGLSPNKVHSHVEWDKRLDVVSIDGIKYDRSKGTLFVIVKSPGSSGKIWQLKSPTGTATSKTLLAHAKKELPDEAVVQTASFDLR